MIANPAIPFPEGVPHPFTLNDLRVHDTIGEEPSSTTSTLTLYGMGLAVVLAIGAFIWLDPLHLFMPTEASPPAPAFVPSAAPARPIETQEIIAPLTPVPATKSVEAPITPAPMARTPQVPAPVVRAPQVPAPVVRPRAASIKPEERAAPPALLATPEEKAATPALLSKPEEQTAPPALLSKPEERMDAPIVPKLGDETKNVPKPAATNDPAPVTE